MGAPDPRTFSGFQERASRGEGWAFRFVLLGLVTGAAGVVLDQAVPGALLVAVILLPVGVGLLFFGILLTVRQIFRRAKETVKVVRSLRQPEPPNPLPDSALGGAIPGNIFLPPAIRSASGRLSWGLVVLAALLAFGVAVGAVDLVIQPPNRTASAFEFLVLFSLLVPALLVMADLQRPIPGLLAEAPSPVVYFTEGGAEGPFYPFSAYQPEAGRSVIRSPWFKFVRVRLPAPNQIPWKLLSVTITWTRGGSDLRTAYISLSRAALPIGFGGLQLTDGFLPTGGTGDRRLGFGMVVAIRRDDLERVLWSASRGGSRLVAVFDQLTPVGQAAVRSAQIAGNSVVNRPLSGPWFVWLPEPGSGPELGSWLS